MISKPDHTHKEIRSLKHISKLTLREECRLKIFINIIEQKDLFRKAFENKVSWRIIA